MRYHKVMSKKEDERFLPGSKTISRRDFLRTSLTILSAPAVLSCSFGGPSKPNSEPTLLARPGTPTISPERGLSELGINSTRDGFLYVPESYSESNKNGMPLLVALHGAGGSSENWESYHARAEERGFVFLAIDSRYSTWDLITIGGFGSDVRFLDAALEHTFERCYINPEHIALCGFSDGASYALSLGVSNGDLFTHLIGYSPGFLAPAKPIVGKPLVFISHGFYDTILPVQGSRNNIVPRFENDDYDVTYREFNGGHEVPAEISEMALDWFLA